MEDFDGQHPSPSSIIASTHMGRHDAASYGLAFNENRGVYARGKPYDVTKKLAVSAAIKEQGNALNIQSVMQRGAMYLGDLSRRFGRR